MRTEPLRYGCDYWSENLRYNTISDHMLEEVKGWLVRLLGQ